MQNSKLLDWSGRICAIAASGPSLIGSQCDHAGEAGARVIAVNSSFGLVDSADVIYAGDFMWWKHNHAAAYLETKYGTQLWTCDSAASERWGINRIKGVNRPGLGKHNIHMNGNSGAQAINLAYLFGCRRILLLGFDMKLGPKGESHWHGDHPKEMMSGKGLFEEWIHKFGPLAKDLKEAGCEVINCTPDSALKCFPMSTIEEEL